MDERFTLVKEKLNDYGYPLRIYKDPQGRPAYETYNKDGCFLRVYFDKRGIQQIEKSLIRIFPKEERALLPAHFRYADPSSPEGKACQLFLLNDDLDQERRALEAEAEEEQRIDARKAEIAANRDRRLERIDQLEVRAQQLALEAAPLMERAG